MFTRTEVTTLQYLKMATFATLNFSAHPVMNHRGTVEFGFSIPKTIRNRYHI
jgi:hypothetical protein